MSDIEAWITTERETVCNYMKSQEQASADLSQNVLTFKADLEEMTQSEIKFASDLVTLAESLDEDAISTTLQGFQSASADVDAEFAALQAMILENNTTAASLASDIVIAASNIDLLNSTRASLGANIANYTGVLSSFRSFVVSASSAPPPAIVEL